jgi:hypothetical protein
VPADELESTDDYVISDEEVTQKTGWDDPEQFPDTGFTAKSVVLAAEEQYDVQENLLSRFSPSPVPGILKRTMEQPAEPEIVLIQSESSASSVSSPRVSS